MASALIFFFFLFSLSSLSTAAPAAPASRSSATPSLVQRTCNFTSYYDFCVASLQQRSSYSQSPAADVKGLSAVAVSLAAANASSTSAFAAALANASADDAGLRGVLRSCAAKYASAYEALQRARDALADENYDYAFVHVSAAAEYPNVCRVLFRRQGPRVAYPAEMARRELDLEHLCTISLEIISLLG